jgi:hypothetical protein
MFPTTSGLLNGGTSLARGGGCPLQPLDGLARKRRDRKRMVIRSTDGSARSVRAIVRDHRHLPVARSVPGAKRLSTERDAGRCSVDRIVRVIFPSWN